MKLNTFYIGRPRLWLPPKLLLIMKLVSFILFFIIMQASAESFSQKVNLNVNNMPLEKVLNAIEQQTGYVFFYEMSELPKVNITVHLKNVSIEVALSESLKNLSLSYKILKKNIVLSKKEKPIVNRMKDFFSTIDIKGKVMDENGMPLPNATIKIKGALPTYTANSNGEFTLKNVAANAILQISYIGYKTKEIAVSASNGSIVVTLELLDNRLNEVQIVNTGYQKMPKERATGSFELIDSAMLNRVVSTNFIDRLEGLSPSLAFINKNNPNVRTAANRIRIRTESSILTLGPPLVVVDNFPYDGDLENINPNDIENITLLKDAAAASIWGIKASRGVIVITTKKGKYNQPLRIDFNSNVTLGEKPDLYAMRQVSPADYIALEKYGFDLGKYNTALNPANTNSPRAVSPAVMVYYQLQQGQIDQATADARLAKLASHDLRDDFLKYVYRPSIKQQYALNLNGGGDKLSYSLSGGYDYNRNNIIASSYDRFTLRSNTILKPMTGLEISTGLSFALGTNNDADDISAYPLDYRLFKGGTSFKPYIYLRLADDAGNPLVYDEAYFRKSWLNSLNSGLESWDYNPLGEVGTRKFSNTSQDLLFNIRAKYQVISGLDAELSYQYEKINQDFNALRGAASFENRMQVNRFSSWQGGILERGVPIGDVLDNTYNLSKGTNLRAQLNFNKEWNNLHQLNVIAGAEQKELDYIKNGDRKYGYNQETLAFMPVNLDSNYLALNGIQGRAFIPNGLSTGGTLSRSVSLYANGAYTYRKKYTVSGSLRRDASNALGVDNNQRWQPLWSAGLAWNVSTEDFYHFDALPYLKLRLTYGYNGNVNTNVSALSLISYGGINQINGLPVASISTPPNPGLTFEKVGVWNAGIDFGLKNQRINGTVEAFIKNGKNLISPMPIDPATGFFNLNGNSANTRGKGVELTLNTDNLVSAAFKWNTTVLFTYNRTIVTKYFTLFPSISSLLSNAQQNPVVGKDATAVYAYRFAGLDPQTGAPMGYDKGKTSMDYSRLLNPTPYSPDSLRYFGSTQPVYAGILRNTFTYKGLSLSATISGKFKYYFRRIGMDYANFFSTGDSNTDFSRRWQKTGDEQHTNVPSFSDNALRNQFYGNSEVMVEPGDQVRLQDIVLNYQVPLKYKNIKNVRCYANATNLNVMIWTKNKLGIDPDFQNFIPYPKTFVLGLSANF